MPETTASLVQPNRPRQKWRCTQDAAPMTRRDSERLDLLGATAERHRRDVPTG
jgi:hypothetical protein